MGKRKRPRKKGKYEAIIKDLDLPQSSPSIQYLEGTVKDKKVKLNLRTEPICWGFPLDEVMFSKFFVNLPSLNMMPWDGIITTESTYLPDARNMIHTSFLKTTDFEWLAMIDSDILAPPWFVDELLAHDKPLVGGWYKHKKMDKGVYNPVVYDYDRTEEDKHGWSVNWYDRRIAPGEGLERVDGLGAGCLLMRRDLAEALGERPYDMNSGGEDLVMCKKVYEAGFDIHVDWSLACAHIGVSYV